MSADVIIPFHGRPDLMRRCLAAFEQRSSFTGRIIVVDDGSASDDARAVRTVVDRLCQPVEWIAFGARRGFVRAVNAAWSRCTQPVVTVLNNDTVLTPTMLHQLEAAIARDPRLGAAAPVSDNALDLYQFRATASVDTHVSPRLTRVPYLTAACIAVRRRAVAGPLFDTAFSPGYFEDFDLSCRLRASGWHLAVVENCRIHHAGRATFGTLPGLPALLSRNYAIFKSRWSRAPEHGDLEARLRRHVGETGAWP